MANSDELKKFRSMVNGESSSEYSGNNDELYRFRKMAERGEDSEYQTVHMQEARSDTAYAVNRYLQNSSDYNKAYSQWISYRPSGKYVDGAADVARRNQDRQKSIKTDMHNAMVRLYSDNSGMYDSDIERASDIVMTANSANKQTGDSISAYTKHWSGVDKDTYEAVNYDPAEDQKNADYWKEVYRRAATSFYGVDKQTGVSKERALSRWNEAETKIQTYTREKERIAQEAAEAAYDHARKENIRNYDPTMDQANVDFLKAVYDRANASVDLVDPITGQNAADAEKLWNQARKRMAQSIFEQQRLADSERWGSVSQNADFSEYSKKQQNSELYDYINDEDFRGYYDDTYTGSILGNTNEYAKYANLKPEEINIFNYYYAKDGEEKAKAYLASLGNTLNSRIGNRQYEDIKGNRALELAFGVEAGLDQFRTGAQGFVDAVSGNDTARPISHIAYASSEIREDLADWGSNVLGNSLGQIAYDAISTTANQLPSWAIGGLAGGTAGAISLGLSAGGNVYEEAIRSGASVGQARAFAAVTAASEAGLEKVLGGIQNFGGLMSNHAMQSAIQSISDVGARIAIQFGGEMLSEGFEEYLQDILEPVFRNIIFDENNEIKLFTTDALYSGMLGAITAGMMNAVSVGIQHRQDVVTGKAIQKSGKVNDLVEQGKKYSMDSLAYLMANKVNENSKPSEIGRLYREMGAFMSEQNKADIERELVETHHLTPDTAKVLSSSVENIMHGEKLSEREIRLLDMNASVASAVVGTMIDQNSTVYQRRMAMNEAYSEVAKAQGNEVAFTKPEEYTKIDRENTFATDENGKLMFNTDEGMMSLRNANLNDAETAVAKLISDTSMDLESANEVWQATENARTKNDAATAIRYAASVQNAYDMGRKNIDYRLGTEGDIFARYASESLRSKLYAKGQTDAAASTRLDTDKRTMRQITKNKKGNVFIKADYKNLSDTQKSGVSVAIVLSRAFGLDFAFFSSFEEGGKRVYKNSNGDIVAAPNGIYDRDTGTIYLDLNAGDNGEGLVLYTMSHELTHFIQQWSPAKYKALSDFLMKEYAAKGKDVNTLVKAQQEKAARNGKKYSYDTAFDEVIADSMQSMLSDTNAIDKLLKLKAKDESLANRLVSQIKLFADKVRAAYAELDPETEEGRAVKGMTDKLDEISTLWADALKDAAENYNAADGQKNTAQEGGVVYMARSMDEEGIGIKDQIRNAKNILDQMSPVVSVNVQDLSNMNQNQKYRWAIDILKATGYKVDRQGFGQISFNEKQINTGMNYLHSDGEIESLAALPRVLKRGKIIYSKEDHKFRKFGTVTIAAPVIINGHTGYMGVVVQKTNDNHYHTHRILMPDGSSFVFDSKNAVPGPSGDLANNARRATNTDTAPTDNLSQPSNHVKQYSSRNLSDKDYSKMSYNDLVIEQQELYQKEKDIRARKNKANKDPELLQAMGEYSDIVYELKSTISKRRNGTASQAEIDRAEQLKKERSAITEKIASIEKKIGLNQIVEEETKLKETMDYLRKLSDEAWAKEGAEKENKAIEKSGLSAPEYFRKKALKAFKTTTNFNEAGYLLPDGKLLNFSGGDRNHRYRDHREIGEIYEATQGVDALNRFMNDGNIRIIAESPGVDISSNVEPTQEQYSQLRNFIRNRGVKCGKFYIDFSDANGNRKGNYSYNGNVNVERVINDIKYFFNNGTTREQSTLSQFLSLRDTQIRTWNDDVNNLKEVLQMQDKATGGKIATRASVIREANALLRFANSNMDRNTLCNSLDNFYYWLADNTDYDWLDVKEKADEIAAQLIRNRKPGELDPYSQEILSQLRGTSVKLNDSQREEVIHRYGSMKEFRKALGGIITISQNGTSLDSIWSELANNYPGTFDPDITDADLGVEIAGIIDSLKNSRIDQIAYDMDFRSELRRRIYESFWNLTTMRTVADKYEKKIEDIVSRHHSRMKEIREENASARRKMTDNRNRKKLRDDIKKILSSLDKRMLRPTEGKYVPKAMKGVVAEILADIDRTSAMGDTAANKLLAALSTQYKAMADTNNDSSYAFDSAVSEMLETVAAYNKPLRDMNVVELKNTKDALTALDHVIKNAAKVESFKILGITEDMNVFQFSKKLIQETRSLPASQRGIAYKFFLTQLRPETVFHWFGCYSKNSAWTAIYNAFDAAQKKGMFIQKDLNACFEQVVISKEARTLFDLNNMVDVGLRSDSGETVYITRGMMLSLYMHLLNEQNAKHVMEGGLTVPNMKDYYRGKLDDAYGVNQIHVFGISQGIAALREEYNRIEQMISNGDENTDVLVLESRLNDIENQIEQMQKDGNVYIDNILSEINGMLTDYERSVISATQELYRKSQKYLNEATMQMYGFEKANVENYFPIITDKAFLGTQFDSISANFNLENAGFMKERTNGANPILLSDIMDVNAKQIRKSAQYASMTPVLKDFNKVFGKTETGYRDSVQKALEQKFNVQGKQYIENLIADLNGGSIARKEISGIDYYLSIVRGNMAQATLSLNLRVALSQAASIPTASVELGRDAVMYSISKTFTKSDLDLIAKYSPLLWYRMQGNSTIKLEDLKRNRTLLGRVRNSKAYNYAMGWCGYVDSWAVQRLWFGAEYWVEHNTKLEKGSDAFYKAVAEKFDATIERTQPNYSTMQMSNIRRSKDPFVKTLTMFTSQRNQNFNILADAWLDLYYTRKQKLDGDRNITQDDVNSAKKKFASAVGSQVVSAGTYVLIRYLVDAVMHNMNAYRDDDDEITFGSTAQEILHQLGASIAGMIIFGAEISDFVYKGLTKKTYYSPSLSGISTICDVLDSAIKAWENPKGENFHELASDFSTVFGFPMNNFVKIHRGIRLHIQDFINHEFFSFEAGVERTTGQQKNRWLEAALDGDTEKVNRVYAELMKYRMSLGDTETEAKKQTDTNIKNAVKDALQSGDIGTDEAEDVLVKNNILGASEVKQKVDWWVFSVDHDNWYDDLFYKYSQYAEPVGITAEMFYEAHEATKTMTADKDKNGNTISGSKKKKVLDYINRLKISKTQKDALYLAAGYSEDDLDETPWN